MKQYLSELSVFFNFDFSVVPTERAIFGAGVLWALMVFVVMAMFHGLTT